MTPHEVPSPKQLKKLLEGFNTQRAKQNTAPVSYTAIAVLVASTCERNCSKSTVASILNDSYNGDTESALRANIYEALLSLGMQPHTPQLAATATLRVDKLGFFTYNRISYYAGGLAGKIIVISPATHDPDGMIITHPFIMVARAIDKSTTQLQAPCHGIHRTPHYHLFSRVGPSRLSRPPCP